MSLSEINDGKEGIVDARAVRFSVDELQITAADQPHLQLTQIQLEKTNWTAWRIAVETALSIKSKDGFIDGSLPELDRSDPLYKQWKRVDNLVLTWLRNSMSPELARLFVHFTTARSLWLELEDRYGRVNGPRALMLRKKISNFTQGSKSVTDYFSELKMLWSDYRALRPYPVCDATIVQVLTKEDDADFLMQFLMGLNEHFEHVCNQIMLMDPLPTASKAYGILCNVEAQKEALSSQGLTGEYVMSIAEQTRKDGLDPGSKKSVVCTYCKKPGHTKDKCLQLANKSAVCDHCKKVGHVKASCFLLTGVPSWYKGAGDKKKGKAVAAAVTSEGPSETYLTESKFEELMKKYLPSLATTSTQNPVEFAGGVYEQAGPLD